MKRATILLLLLAIGMPVFAATYYIDYLNGNDLNSGTCETASGSCTGPWQHAPEMQGFTGTYTHSGGDQIIFEGGDTWPNANFPMIIPYSGIVSSTQDYYGVDTTWFNSGVCGASFCRPIFDMGNSVVASTNDVIVISAGAGQLIIDNLEIRNLHWTGTGQAGAIFLEANSTLATLSNLYIHTWNHDAAPGTQDVFHAIDAQSPNGGTIVNSVITGLGSGGDTQSGTGIYNVLQVSSCSIHDLSNGVVSNGPINEIMNSRLFNIYASFAGSASQAILTTGISIISGNYIHDFTNATEGIVTQPSYSNVFGNDSTYNNLVWNTGAKTPFIMDTSGPTAASANPSFFNNTIVPDTNGYCLQIGLSPTGTLGTLTFANNQCISDINPSTGMLCTGGSCAALAGQAGADNILESHLVATTSGYTVADFFSPTASTSPTVGQGMSNDTVQAATDIRYVPRPFGAYDVGAYQYYPGCGYSPCPLPVAAISITPQSGTVPLTVNFDASQSTTSIGTITSYTWNFGDGSPAVGPLTSPTTSHIYTFAGNFRSSVTITTTNNEAPTSSASTYGIIVVEPRPAGLVVASTQAQAGATVSLDVTMSTSPDVGMASLQFDVVLPAAVSYDTCTLGPVSIAAGKQIAQNPAIPRVVISGFNATVISSGVVAIVQLTVAPGTPAGTLPISLTNVMASDPTSFIIIPVTVTAGNITVVQSGTSTSSLTFAPRAYPNPWRSDQDGGLPITFDRLVGNSTIDIFTVSGHLVRSLTASGGSTTWDRTNKSGDTVASGLYFYVITNDLGQKASGKFVIIK